MSVETVDVTALLNMPRGSTMVYHTGLLARDRSPDLSSLPTAQREALAEEAALAWKLFEAGKITLTQRRKAPGICDYIAVRL